ncbi:MAG TPA: hypothetical protein PKY82_26440 [Pyrinomonadaceae bacterium]|nr:hypothetical protein [Pyrinomonadaceae bacterium]
MRLSDLREKYCNSPKRPKRLRFFDELSAEAQEYAIFSERENGERFDWDDAQFLTEDFKMQLAEYGFEGLEVYWSLGYCQGDGVAFYGNVDNENLKDKDRQAEKLINRLEAAGDEISIEITGKHGHYHHWNSMSVEIDYESETDEEDLPSRLKIAHPVWRESLDGYLDEKVKEISRELEKCGYAEIEYRHSDEIIRQELIERGNLYEKDGILAMSESEVAGWKKQNLQF